MTKCIQRIVPGNIKPGDVPYDWEINSGLEEGSDKSSKPDLNIGISEEAPAVDAVFFEEEDVEERATRKMKLDQELEVC